MQLSDIKTQLNWLGIDTASIPDSADIRVAWENLPTSLWWVALFGAIALGMLFIFWLYLKELNTAPTWVKVTLGCLRTAVLLVLVVIALGPSLVHDKESRTYPFVQTVFDVSQSMTHRDAYLNDDVAQRVAKVMGTDIDAVREQKPSREEIVAAAVRANDNELVRELEFLGKLRVLNFGTGVEQRDKDRAPRRRAEDIAAEEEYEEPELKPLPEFTAASPGSDMYRMLETALDTGHSAGIVVFTDGQHTDNRHQRDDLIALASQEGVPEKDRVPIFFVGVGDTAKPRDLAVAEMYADPQVFPEEPFAVEAVVRGQDVGDRPIKIDLIQQQLDKEGNKIGNPLVVDTKTNQRVPESGKLDLRFEVTADKPGKYAYIVRVEKIENEANNDNNEPDAPIVVRVLDNKAKVLLVAGAPTWEYRMVQRLLTREDTVDLSCWLQTLDENRAQEGNSVITQLPVTKQQLFEYDVVMLFDPDPVEFDEKWIELLREFVSEHAGGVLYMAGAKFTDDFLGGPRTRDLEKILPVRLGDVREKGVILEEKYHTTPSLLEPVAQNIEQPMMRFKNDPGETLALWRGMPGIYWSFPPDEARPAARVLIEHNHHFYNRRPILVTGQYGTGRAVYMGFNGTWRWRKMGRNAEYFKRFWIQTTRFLIEGRALEGRRRGYVEVDKARYELGEVANITVDQLRDVNFTPISEDSIKAEIKTEDGRTTSVTLRPVPNQPGNYYGSFTPRKTGRHNLRLEMPASAGASPPKIENTFAVTLPAVETDELILNKPLLVDLAAASGGQYLEIDELDQLPALIPTDRNRTVITPSEPKPLWDTNRLLILLVALLGIEWAVRKGHKLL